MPDERARVLDLLSEGKITVEEAETLLDALGAPSDQRAQGDAGAAGASRARGLRIRVTDTRSGCVKTSIRVPSRGWPLLTKLTRTKLGRRLGGLALHDIERAAREGVTGNILDSTNSERGERVEIFFE